MRRCPPGQRRNRITGLCEECPPGTRRQGKKCVPAVPAAPAAVPLAPAFAAPAFAAAPVGVAPLTIARNIRMNCPAGYRRSKFAPFNCEKCPVNTRRNNRTRLCDPDGAPAVPIVPAVPAVPIGPIGVALPGDNPLIVIPRAIHLKCPNGTRRNKRTGNCEGCPPNTRRVGNICRPNAAIAPAHVAPAHVAPAHVAPAHVAPAHVAPAHVAPAHVAPAHVAPAHVAPAALPVLIYDGLLKPSTNPTEATIANELARIDQYIVLNNHLATELYINQLYTIIEHLPFRHVSIHFFMYFMNKTLRLLALAQQNIFGRLPNHLHPLYSLLYATFSEKAFLFDTTSVNHILTTQMPALNPILLVGFGNMSEQLLEVFEDHGIFYKQHNGEVFIIPAAFIELHNVALPQTPMAAPATMFDLEMYADVPFNSNVPGNLCIVVQDGVHISAASFDVDMVRKAINPRVPRWLFMTCVAPIHGYYIGENTVHHDLYLGLQKIGFPQQLYVDVNQLHTAILNGHTCVIIKPRMVASDAAAIAAAVAAGLAAPPALIKYVPQLAAASLFKTMGKNVVGRSHCEVGHLGGIYDVCVPAP